MFIIPFLQHLSQQQVKVLFEAATKLLQLCPTLCDPIDSSPAGLSVPGILQARILEWVAISFSNAWKWKLKVKLLGRVRLLATPWTAAYQAPPSTGFSRQEYWSGVPLSICLSCCKWYYFILLNDWVVFHYIYLLHLLYPSVDGHLNCFRVWLLWTVLLWT